MKAIIWLSLIVALINAVPQAIAGNGSGKIEIEHVGYKVNSQPLLFFYTETHVNQPACNAPRKRWVLDLATTEGQAQYSLLLAAQSASRSVVVWGTNTCSLTSDSETVHWVGFPVDYSNHPFN